MKTRASRPTFTVQERFSECFHSCEVSMEGIRSSMVNFLPSQSASSSSSSSLKLELIAASGAAQCRSAAQNRRIVSRRRRLLRRARGARRECVCGTVPTSLETAPGSEGLVFIAALKQGSVFILGGFQSAFRVKCKPADVFSYYPPLQYKSFL